MVLNEAGNSAKTSFESRADSQPPCETSGWRTLMSVVDLRVDRVNTLLALQMQT